MSEITLFEGSWQQGLQYVAPKIDSVIFSPPFNTNFPYEGYDDNLERGLYLKSMGDLAAALAKNANEDCVVWLQIDSNMKDPSLPVWVVEEFLRRGWLLRNQICWLKSGTFPQKDGSEANFGHYRPMNSPDRLHSTWGTVYMLTLGKVTLDKKAVGTVYSDMSNAKRWGNPEGLRCRGDMWFIPYETKQKTGHPCPFPVKLVENCLKIQGLKPGSVVFDPFAGSGTVGVAAKSLGMYAFMCEISPTYCDLIEERIPDVRRFK